VFFRGEVIESDVQGLLVGGIAVVW